MPLIECYTSNSAIKIFNDFFASFAFTTGTTEINILLVFFSLQSLSRVKTIINLDLYSIFTFWSLDIGDVSGNRDVEEITLLKKLLD